MFSRVLFVACVLIAFCNAQEQSKESADAAIPPTTAPIVIDRSQNMKRCPKGFEMLGKECVKVVTIPSIPKCPPGSELTPEGTCATFSGKTPQCPEDFEQLGSRCEHRQTAEPSLFCEPGFTLTDQDQCVAPIEPVPVEECPGGSQRKGDLCLTEEEREPEVSCPPNFTLEGKKCRIEELYNCTPPRRDRGATVPNASASSGAFSASPVPQSAAQETPSPPSFEPPFLGSKSSPVYSESYSERRRQRESIAQSSPAKPMRNPWRRTQIGSPSMGKQFSPEQIDYVVQATCKRIRTIPAQETCPQGVLSGKMCRVEVEVPPLLVSPFGVLNDIRPSQPRCPQGFSLLSRTVCLFSELRSVIFVCPEGTQDVGDRCATFTSPTPTCPQRFALENDNTCVQTLHAPQITEYSVRFSCVGKECAGN